MGSTVRSECAGAPREGCGGGRREFGYWRGKAFWSNCLLEGTERARFDLIGLQSDEGMSLKVGG